MRCVHDIDCKNAYKAWKFIDLIIESLTVRIPGNADILPDQVLFVVNRNHRECGEAVPDLLTDFDPCHVRYIDLQNNTPHGF